MANGENGGRTRPWHMYASAMGGVAAAIVGIGVVINQYNAPLQVQATQNTSAIQTHVALEGHPGVLADVRTLRNEVIELEKLRRENQRRIERLESVTATVDERLSRIEGENRCACRPNTKP